VEAVMENNSAFAFEVMTPPRLQLSTNRIERTAKETIAPTDEGINSTRPATYLAWIRNRMLPVVVIRTTIQTA
jgi:hypothetical protein